MTNNFKNYFNKKKINPIKLGSNFGRRFNQDYKKKNSDNIKFLIVGTLEPRKGHKEIVKIFNNIAEEDFNIELIIVGKLGWKYDDILQEITTSKFFNNRLFYYQNLRDYDLTKKYLSCDIVIVPSYDEGFGLPIVEGINFKKIVLARNIEIFRELKQNNLFFFPKKNKIKIKKYFKTFIKEYRQKKIKVKKINTYHWIDTYKKIKILTNIID